jgi:hypothetical protein
MAGAYPQALIAQRNLFQLEDAYVDSLKSIWQRSIEIRGLLLDGGITLESSGFWDGPTPMNGADHGNAP